MDLDHSPSPSPSSSPSGGTRSTHTCVCGGEGIGSFDRQAFARLHPVDATALHDLRSQFNSYMSDAHVRMTRIEGGIMQVLDMMSQQSKAISALQDGQQQQQQELLMMSGNKNKNDGDSLAAASSSPSSSSSLKLRVVGMENKWYTKRPFPDFEIQVCDEHTGEVFTETADWNVALNLVSGHGLYVNQFLVNPTELVFPVNEGRAFVSGLKFLAVTSRNGGYFQFELNARIPKTSTSGPSEIPPARSSEISILSERLKNDCKASSILDLTADDPLVRVPGIGKRYATKLSEQGLCTVRDLASIDNSPSGRQRRLALLNSVRKDRGALTEAKLAEMLRQAKTVVRRDTKRPGTEQHHQSASTAALALLATTNPPTTAAAAPGGASAPPPNATATTTNPSTTTPGSSSSKEDQFAQLSSLSMPEDMLNMDYTNPPLPSPQLFSMIPAPLSASPGMFALPSKSKALEHPSEEDVSSKDVSAASKYGFSSDPENEVDSMINDQGLDFW